MSAYAVEILLVDNNPESVQITLDLFRAIKLTNRVHTVNSSQAALSFLQESTNTNTPRPDIIFLEPCLPDNDGDKFLQELVRIPYLANIPVVFLLTPDITCDTIQYADLMIPFYVPKPLTGESLFNVVKRMDGFWVSIIQSDINPLVDRV